MKIRRGDEMRRHTLPHVSPQHVKVTRQVDRFSTHGREVWWYWQCSCGLAAKLVTHAQAVHEGHGHALGHGRIEGFFLS